MITPDKAELGPKFVTTPENPKKSGYLPRWLRVPACVARTSFAILTTIPGAAISADAIIHTDSPGIVHASETLGVAGATLLGVRPASAETPTPPSLSATPAPDFAGAVKATLTAVANDEAQIKKRIDDRLTAIAADDKKVQERVEATQVARDLRTATTEAVKTREAGIIKEDSEGKASATAKALLKNTPTPTPTSTSVPEGGPPASGGGFSLPSVPTEVVVVGIGAAFFAGLTANEIYKRWRFRKGVNNGATTGTAGSTGSSASQPYGGPSNPNTAPSTGSANPKNPEWVIGQHEFERRWQAAKSKFSPVRLSDNGNEPEYILDRFKTGMNIIHEVLLEDATNTPEMNTRVRAGIEYLIPEIWPTNEIFERFFDPNFNAGFLTHEDLAKIIYLPEQYRNLSIFTKGQKRDINQIRRILLHAIHPDLSKSEADPKLQAQIDTLLKQLNSTWPLINKLLS